MNGAPGVRAVERLLPPLREELSVDFCVTNGENAADGLGLTPRIAEKILASGADVITLGNHTWRRKEIAPYLAETDRVIRPANLSAHMPGRGLAIAEGSDGTPVAVINVLGQLFLAPPMGPWEVIDDLVAEARRTTGVILVDFHGEATSEKVAMAAYLDGKVTAVIGTHTHIQTNDARVSARGTAAITDAGMTGPHDSVIGVVTELAVEQMRTGMPIRFRTASGDVRLEGVLVDCDGEGRARRCEPVRAELDQQEPR
ncbi:MAG TPA: TIGR00282 family metallophosphoesterase [Gaiellaceae bacterium]|nr:TIGR00282 family metallophosphoesterase [Gaiellaceae bacterium]